MTTRTWAKSPAEMSYTKNSETKQGESLESDVAGGFLRMIVRRNIVRSLCSVTDTQTTHNVTGLS